MREYQKRVYQKEQELVRDYLNGQANICEIAEDFDLKICSKCEQWNLEENIKEIDNEFVCESCQEDY